MRENKRVFLDNMLNGSYQLAKHNERFVEQMARIDGQMHEEDV